MATRMLTNEDTMYSELHEELVGLGSRSMFFKMFNYYAEVEVNNIAEDSLFKAKMVKYKYLALYNESKFILLDISRVHENFSEWGLGCTGFKCIASYPFNISFVQLKYLDAPPGRPCEYIWSYLPSKIGDLYSWLR